MKRLRSVEEKGDKRQPPGKLLCSPRGPPPGPAPLRALDLLEPRAESAGAEK